MAERPEYEDWVEIRDNAARIGDYLQFYQACAETCYAPKTDYEKDLVSRAEHELGLEKLARSEESGFFQPEIKPGRDFWIPRRKYQLREGIVKLCEQKGVSIPRNLGKMRKNQLYAIYINMAIDAKRRGK